MIKSRVIFNELEHTYTLDGKNLSGITSILNKYLFPDKYKGVPSEALNNAAEYGSLVHSQVQMDFEGFPPAEPTEEFKALKGLGIQFLASEYLVSNEKSVASSIDLVGEDYSLYDIKTTSTLDKEYVSWQLSVYAYLFELQNPNLKANNLYAIHLRGSVAKVVEVQRVPTEYVIALIEAYEQGAETFTNPLKVVATEEEKLLANLHKLEQEIIERELVLEKLKADRKALTDGLMTIMDERGIIKWETDNVVITRKSDSTRESVDNKALKELYPLIYEQLKKTSHVRGSIIIKTKTLNN